MSTSKKSQSDIAIVPGGWSPWSFEISQEEKEVLQKATAAVNGGSFIPVSVATQEVSGTNFSFVCESSSWKLKGMTYIAILHIHRSTEGAIELKELKPLGPNPGHKSGYASWHFSISTSILEMFDSTGGLDEDSLIIDYKPISYTTRDVKNGTEYAFLTEYTLTMGGKILKTSPYLIYIYEPNDGGKPMLEQKELVRPN